MGALRAAELSAFGMEGIGKIYEDYAARNIEDDDEVAVAHGPAELGFPAVSDAMVNIRATLNAAVRAQAVTAEESALLVRIAKGMFYKDRTYNNLLATAFRQGMSKDKLSSLDAWFRKNRIDQKQIDAVLLLQTVLQWLNRQVAPKQVLYHFEETVLWRSARRSIFHEESNAS
jgi:hypothetical protein